MHAASPAASQPLPRPRFAAFMEPRPLAVTLVVTALITALRVTGTVDSDVAWQLWIAGRIHAGAILYRDIMETNPPLWFWMALPVDRVATVLHLPAETVLISVMGTMVALALAATDRLLRHVPAGRRTLLLAYGALILMAMPWIHVGQREQIVLIGTLPYAALIAARHRRRRVPPLLATLIGIGAATAFALKHYFLIVPMFLELWLIVSRGRRWRGVRPETLAIASAGLAYAAAMLLFAGDYLTKMVPLVRLAYGVTGVPNPGDLLGPFAIVGLIVLIFAAAQAHWSTNAETPVTSALLVSAFAFAAVYFMQAKGWPYHAIPLIGCSSLALAALLVETDRYPATLRTFAPALLIVPLVLAAEEQTHQPLPNRELLNAVAGVKRGETVAFLTTENAVPWSVTFQRGFRYPSRYMGFWMMRAIVRNEQLPRPDQRLSALGRQIVFETAQDFECAPPRRIVVDRPRPGEKSFDILPFFLRSAEFTALMSHYRVRSRTSFETYELTTRLPPPSSACRAGI
jgi:hypothetical protein